MISGARRRQAMEIALKAHHEKRDLILDEAKELVPLGRWLRRRLAEILGEPGPPRAQVVGGAGPNPSVEATDV